MLKLRFYKTDNGPSVNSNESSEFLWSNTWAVWTNFIWLFSFTLESVITVGFHCTSDGISPFLKTLIIWLGHVNKGSIKDKQKLALRFQFWVNYPFKLIIQMIQLPNNQNKKKKGSSRPMPFLKVHDWAKFTHTGRSFCFFLPQDEDVEGVRDVHTHTHRASDTRWRDVLKAVQYRAAAALAQILMAVNSLEASPRTSERLWLQRQRSPQPTRSARGPPSHCSEKPVWVLLRDLDAL